METSAVEPGRWEEGDVPAGVTIDDDLCIGPACTILKGLRIGKGRAWPTAP
jgi:acetyltransferase-like isoleucine patch superfamily enzyme